MWGTQGNEGTRLLPPIRTSGVTNQWFPWRLWSDCFDLCSLTSVICSYPPCQHSQVKNNLSLFVYISVMHIHTHTHTHTSTFAKQRKFNYPYYIWHNSYRRDSITLSDISYVCEWGQCRGKLTLVAIADRNGCGEEWSPWLSRCAWGVDHLERKSLGRLPDVPLCCAAEWHLAGRASGTGAIPAFFCHFWFQGLTLSDVTALLTSLQNSLLNHRQLHILSPTHMKYISIDLKGFFQAFQTHPKSSRYMVTG